MNINASVTTVVQSMEAHFAGHVWGDDVPRVHFYENLHPRMGVARDVALPGVFVEATYSAAVERDALNFLPAMPPEIVVSVICAARLDTYAEAVRIRNVILDEVWAWAIGDGRTPCVTWLGADGDATNARSLVIGGNINIGRIEEWP